MKTRMGITRRAQIKTMVEGLFPDRYIIYKKDVTAVDSLGFLSVTETAISYNGSIEIPCLFSEYRLMREAFQTLGQDVAINYTELVTYSDAPLYVDHIIQNVVTRIRYEVNKISRPTEYAPYQLAFLVHVEEAYHAG